jgi:hypothetical protein
MKIKTKDLNIEVSKKQISPFQRGQVGGKACLKKYGPDFYRKMAKKQWKERNKLLKIALD